MFMICWFYCIPFAKFLYFALSGLLFVIAVFMLKRGMLRKRRGLRLTAFCLMWFATFKAFILDVRMLKRDVLCAPDSETLLSLQCDRRGMIIADMLGLVGFVAVSFAILHFYKLYMPERHQQIKTPDQMQLRFWANASLAMVVAMIIWLSAPWIGYLTVGYVPALFTAISWKFFAIINLALLLNGFWRAESCVWNYEVKSKNSLGHLNKVWTPKDTLWMNAFFYLIALALSYVAQDVLTK